MSIFLNCKRLPLSCLVSQVGVTACLPLTSPPTDTFSNDFFDYHGCVINTVHHILICITCRRVVNHLDARGHFAADNKSVTLPMDFSDTFRRQSLQYYPRLVYPPIVPTQPVAPIYGLHPPQPGVQICHQCDKGYQDTQPGKDLSRPSKSFRKHPCPLPYSFSVHPAQRFGPLQTNAWFPVLAVAPPSPPANAWTAYQSHLRSTPPPSTKLSIPDNYRILHQFIAKSRWLEHVAGKDVSTLIPLVAVTHSDPKLPGLKRHIEALLLKLQADLPPGEHFARRLLSTRPS
jgi:hypothetical protein